MSEESQIIFLFIILLVVGLIGIYALNEIEKWINRQFIKWISKPPKQKGSTPNKANMRVRKKPLVTESDSKTYNDDSFG
jgi:hypothetical protein